MKVPVSWLREYCDPGLGAQELAELLSMRAVEVERVSSFGAPSSEGFVIGRVLSVDQHPNADRLTVCVVDAGDGERTIVCGAPNVAAGQTVPVALPGAILPGGQRLGKAKLRGVESAGMILAEDELGLGPDHAGILVLTDQDQPQPVGSSASRPGPPGSAAGLEPGTPLTELIPVSDEVLELDLNPNRSDCLGVYGVAREVHALTGAPLAAAPWEQDAEATASESVEEVASVRVAVPQLCPRFTARGCTGVEIGPSPLWMRAWLAAAGQRPISNVVDVTNYVMLLIGQPLHAFDLDRVPGGELIVRAARSGETMTTLDGVERTFDDQAVLICDRDQITSIAGIMGGQVSEVSAETKRVLLEVATWNGPNILHTSSMLGLRSEASARFEKQLHPELAIRAQRVASRLLVDSGAELMQGMIDVATEPPAPHVIFLRGERTAAVLGVSVPGDEAAEGLGRLGFEVAPQGEDDLRVTITPERHFDVAREIDVIEEVGRLHGFDRLPRTLPAHGERGGLDRQQRLRRRIEDTFCTLGFDQAITWSLTSRAVADRLRLPPDDPRRRWIAVANPLSAEREVMRTTLLGGLLEATRHNLARGAERVALFESGRAYLAEPAPKSGGVHAGAFDGRLSAPAREPHRLACVLIGSLGRAGWRGESEPGDFYTLKGVIEALCETLGCEPAFSPRDEPFLHPGRSARVAVGGADAGWLGELHPAVAATWDLPNAVAFELDVAPLFEAAAGDAELYEDLITFPAVLHDLAVVVPDDVSAEAVRTTVADGGGELLRSVRLFDLYRGEQIAPDHKSLALSLEFRAPDRTLTEAEVAELRERIREALQRIGGALRE